MEFLPFFSADPLMLCEVGWGALLHSYFQVSPDMLDWVQVQALAGPFKNIETCPEATPALSWLCAEGRYPVGRFEVLSALLQVFIKYLSVLCACHGRHKEEAKAQRDKRTF